MKKSRPENISIWIFALDIIDSLDENQNSDLHLTGLLKILLFCGNSIYRQKCCHLLKEVKKMIGYHINCRRARVSWELGLVRIFFIVGPAGTLWWTLRENGLLEFLRTLTCTIRWFFYANHPSNCGLFRNCSQCIFCFADTGQKSTFWSILVRIESNIYLLTRR